MKTAMRSKQVTVIVEEPIYGFGELTDEAKERTINDYRSSDEYPWDYEVRETITAIGKHMGLNPKWEISVCSYSYVDFSGDVEELIGVRAYTWIYNNWIEPLLAAKKLYKGSRKRESRVQLEICCPFTGYYLDDEFIRAWDDFAAEIRKGKDLDIEDFVRMVGQYLCEAVVDDMEYRESDEFIIEELSQAEFFDDGTIAG